MSASSTPDLGGRHDRARAVCRSLGLDALVVTAPANVRYLTGVEASRATVLLTPTRLLFFTDGRYRTAIESRQASDGACPGLVLVIVEGPEDPAIAAALGEETAESVGIEAQNLTVSRYLDLTDAVQMLGPAIHVRAAEGIIESLRIRKDASEQGIFREAGLRLSAVLDGVLADLAVGVSERRIAQAIEAGLRRMGFSRPAFDTIVASGPASALPHARAGDRTMAAGDLVVIDCGGVLDGYSVDITRTVAAGPVPEDARRLYGVVQQAHAAAAAVVRPGVSFTDVDRAARDVITAAGYGAAFVHATGHGLGLEVHEAPRIGRPQAAAPGTAGRAVRLRPDMPDRLDVGMVFTIEPGIYVPGFGGARLEDDVLVTAEGCDVLTTVDRALRVY